MTLGAAGGPPLLAGLIAATFGASPALDPQAIVRCADDIRNPALSYRVDVRITTSTPGRPEDVSFYRVFVKDRDRTFVEFLEPVRYRGMALLMSGQDSWLYLPSLGRATRVSSYQELSGNVANGDIARLNFSQDYRVEEAAEEAPRGRLLYRLELRSRRRSATYNRVVLTVERNTCRPVRAEFYAVSGRLLKTGIYDDFREVLGALRPTRLVLEGATATATRSVMEFSRFELADLPDRMFTRSHIARPR